MGKFAHSFYYGGKYLAKVKDSVIEEIKPIIAARNDEFVDMEYVKEKGQNYLRIYVDRENGLSIPGEETSKIYGSGNGSGCN